MHDTKSGTEIIDELIGGAFEKEIVSTIYGPSGSGKTNFAICAILKIASQGKKVIFVDTEGGFSVDRMKQIVPNHEELLEKIIFFKPTSFQEQKEAFDKLRAVVDEKVGLIVVDSIAMLYRLELGKSDDVYNVNRALGQQISYLTEIARKQKIPVLVTNQVYSNFEIKNKVNMVGGDILKYGSKCLIELTLDEVTRKRRAILRKHRSLPEGKAIQYKIEQKGVVRDDARFDPNEYKY